MWILFVLDLFFLRLGVLPSKRTPPESLSQDFLHVTLGWGQIPSGKLNCFVYVESVYISSRSLMNFFPKGVLLCRNWPLQPASEMYPLKAAKWYTKALTFLVKFLNSKTNTTLFTIRLKIWGIADETLYLQYSGLTSWVLIRKRRAPGVQFVDKVLYWKVQCGCN